MNTVIKAADMRDISMIHKLSLQIFPLTYQNILSVDQLNYMMDWMYSEKNLLKQMEDGHRYFIAYVDDLPAGYVSIRQESKDIFHLEKLYVLREYQKKGLGKELFFHAIKMIKENHPEKCDMHLNVNRKNVALEFYKRMGMTELESGDYPIGNGYFMNDYIMSITI